MERERENLTKAENCTNNWERNAIVLGKVDVTHYKLIITVTNYLLILQRDIQKLLLLVCGGDGLFAVFEKLPNNITLCNTALWQGTSLAMETGKWTLCLHRTSTLSTHYVGFFSSLFLWGPGYMFPWLPTVASECEDWREVKGIKIL